MRGRSALHPVDEANHRLAASLDFEGGARDKSIVAQQAGLFEMRENKLFERLNLDLKEINGSARGGVRVCSECKVSLDQLQQLGVPYVRGFLTGGMGSSN